MKRSDRRSRSILAAVAVAAVVSLGSTSRASGEPLPVERWGTFELTLSGPEGGNPSVDVSLEVEFSQGGQKLTVSGFYDGDGRYLVRFMPPGTGVWQYVTQSNQRALDGQSGRVEVGPPSPGSHGPVRVRDRFHFEYADGTPYYPIGTTAYAWIHMPASLQEQTLRTLTDSR